MMLKRYILIVLLVVGSLFHVSKIEANAVTTFSMQSQENESNDFMTGAMKSLDEEVAKKESDENYIKNFFNSTQTVTSEGFNVLKGETYIITIFHFLITIIETLASIISFVVMILYNMIASSTLEKIIQSVLGVVEDVVFDWSNPSSWIIKVIILASLFSILYSLIKSFNKIKSPKQIISIMLSTVLTMSAIVFIGQYGRPIISSLESNAKSLIVQTFVFDGQDENVEIRNKESIFEIVQLQPFMLRHYGTLSYQDIANWSKQTVQEAKGRVQTLLDDPSEENAVKEYEDYNNANIIHDSASAMRTFCYSLLDIVHRVMIAMIMIVFCVITGLVKVLKEILLFLSIYQLIWWLLKRNYSARQWFIDRMNWSLIAITVDMFFSIALFFILEICRQISSIHPLLMIVFDLLLLCIIVYCIKNAGHFYAKFKDAGEEIVVSAITGQTPKYSINNLKNSIFESSGETNVMNDNDRDDYNDKSHYDEQSYEDLSEQDASLSDIQTDNDYSKVENLSDENNNESNSNNSYKSNVNKDSNQKTEIVPDSGTSEKEEINQSDNATAEENVGTEKQSIQDVTTTVENLSDKDENNVDHVDIEDVDTEGEYQNVPDSGTNSEEDLSDIDESMEHHVDAEDVNTEDEYQNVPDSGTGSEEDLSDTDESMDEHVDIEDMNTEGEYQNVPDSGTNSEEDLSDIDENNVNHVDVEDMNAEGEYQNVPNSGATQEAYLEDDNLNMEHKEVSAEVNDKEVDVPNSGTNIKDIPQSISNTSQVNNESITSVDNEYYQDNSEGRVNYNEVSQVQYKNSAKDTDDSKEELEQELLLKELKKHEDN